MRRLPIHLLVTVFLVLSACVAQPAAVSSPPDSAAANSAAAAVSPVENLHDSCVELYDPAIDYFPQKLSVAYASGFDVEYHNNYKVVTVTNPWQGAQESFRYVLLQCGTPAPQDVKGTVIL